MEGNLLDKLKELLKTEIELLKNYSLFLFGIAAGVYNLLGKKLVVMEVDITNWTLGVGMFLLLLFFVMFLMSLLKISKLKDELRKC